MLTSMLCAVSLLAAQAAAPEASSLKTEVAALVKRLDASGLAQREAAEKALIDLGPRILDLLPVLPDEPRHAEVNQRLGRIRQVLQDRAVGEVAAASVVTLKADKMPLSKVLAAIEQQTGNRIVDGRKGNAAPVPDPELTVAFDKTPFWQALDTVLDQTGMTVYPFAQDAIQVVPRPEQHLPRLGRAAYSGPFRIEAVRVVARRELRAAIDPALLLNLEFAWEPRLRPIGIKQRMGDVQAVDEAGKPLAVDDPDAESEALLRRGASAVEMAVPLRLPSREVKEIASFKGSVQAIVPGKVETFAFGDLLKAKNAQKRIAGATVTLERVRKTEDNLWEVHVRVQFDDAGKALESHRSWVAQNEAFLQGDDGKPIPAEASESTQRGKNEFGMGYVFALEKPPAGLTFVYKTPGAVITKSYPYELKNLSMP